MRVKIILIAIIATLILTPKFAMAIPMLQVYIEGSSAGDFGSDKDTWLIAPADVFNLHIVGAYGRDDVSITNVTLLATVRQSQTGTIGGLGAGVYHDTLSFLPDTTPDLKHFPLNKPDLYDFYTFDLGSLGNVTTGLNNYDADNGTITFDANAQGQDKIFNAAVAGYDYMHFDVYARFTDDDHDVKWRANPGSHDAADPEIPRTPEPASMGLLGMGLVGLLVRSKRSL